VKPEEDPLSLERCRAMAGPGMQGSLGNDSMRAVFPCPHCAGHLMITQSGDAKTTAIWPLKWEEGEEEE